MKSKSNGTVTGIFHKLSPIETALARIDQNERAAKAWVEDAKKRAAKAAKAPEPKLKAGIIYSGDNGQLVCLHCAGMTALYTGRDRSGHKVEALGPEDAVAWREQFGTDLTCEEGCTKYPTKAVEAKSEVCPFALRFGSHKTVTGVRTMKEAAALYRGILEENDLGASMSPQGTIIDTATGETIARVSYNGRVWDMQGKEIL